MFYTKGSTLLLSSEPSSVAISIEEEGLKAQQQHQPGNSSSEAGHSRGLALSDSAVIHLFLTYTDRLPFFIFAATILSMVAYLYTLVVLPFAMTATINHTNRTQVILDNNGTYVPLDIGCPFLTPRSSPATSVHDLRPDDIRIVAGIGDSVMAAFAAKGLEDRSFFNIKNLYENRGISFSMGGDPDTFTVPNIINYYSHDLLGSSKGDHLISICFGNQVCPKGQFRPKIDVLNAAQSGARSLNLDHEIDYLEEQLNELYENGKAKPTDWKLLTFFMGSNDLCHSCTEPTSLPTPFAANVLAAVERLRATMTNTLIQIIGLMRVQDIVVATSNFTDYCTPIPFSTFIGHDHECECSHSVVNRTIMLENFPKYNEALENIVKQYQVTEDPNFAVVFQPLLIDIMSFPIEAISNIDCFHPSALAHGWMSKMLWKMMFMSPDEKKLTLKYDANASIFCPTDNDRIQTR